MEKTQQSMTERMCLSFMKQHTKEKAEWNYPNGLAMECVYKAGKALGRREWLDWVQGFYDLFIDDDGTVKTYDPHEYSMDQLSPGKVCFDLYLKTGNEKYKKALDLFFDSLMHQPRTPEGGFWHKLRYPNQMWLDGLYMQGPFYVRYAAQFGDLHACLDDLVRQFELIWSKTRDGKTGLLYHAWDSSRKMPWCDPLTGLSPCFWSRALGWYCMALVDVLDYISDEDEWYSYRTRLMALSDSLVAPILSVQDGKTGLWWQVLDQGGREGNYLESSGSTMFAYFLMKMVRKGYLRGTEATRAREAGARAWRSLVDLEVTEDEEGVWHLHGICRGAGLGKAYDAGPYRDGTYEYYTQREPVVTDNPQAIGPFILACMENEFPDRLQV